MENAGVRETAKPSEVIKGKYNLHFEPGVHVFPLADKVLRHPTPEELFARFDAGDLTAHAWNPQVAQRMKQYGPIAIGLDSIPGSSVTPANSMFWLWLPGSPKEMTGRNETHIVGGDLLHFQLLDDPVSGYFEKWKDELRKIGWGNVSGYAKSILGAEIVGEHVFLPLSMLLAYRLLSNKNNEKGAGVKNPDRRLFLKKAAATVGVLSLATLLGRLAPLIQSYSPTPLTEDLSQKITDLTKPFTRSAWLEGRTALVIAKTIEAMDKLGLPQGSHGSVVMGFPHAYEVGSFLTYKNTRMEAIRKYAQEFFNEVYPTIPDDVLWEVAAFDEMQKTGEKLSDIDSLKRLRARTNDIKNKRSTDTEWKKSLIMDVLLPYFTATTVYKVKEPDSYYVDNPDGAVRELISVVKRFPSQEVKEAVSPLGDPERFQVEVKP